MANVRIVTDVTANLDPGLVEQFKITVLPIEIRVGDALHVIGPGEAGEDLFEQMAEDPAQSSSVTIPASVFHRAFTELCRQTEQILVIVTSSKLSGAFEQARIASQAFLGRCRIVVLDSMSVSWGLGLMVRAAARAASRSLLLDEIVRMVRGILPHIYFVFLVERLDYLEKGGRLGAAQALLGTMLRIKPLLLMEDGEIVSLEKVRTRSAALEKLVDFVTEFATIEEVMILKSPVDSELNGLIPELKELLKQALPRQQFETIDYDPILATHLGPEALGIIVYEGL
ncbi:MAG: DegV family protein [Anaerolineae bacterium]|nr:DegV family protein [Anaerolineae bacterium]